MNRKTFERMAHGDIPGLKELSFEFFDDIRGKLGAWGKLGESGDFEALKAELHRCKGGASIFGLERLIALITDYESTPVLEERGFDAAGFETEFAAAEDAVRSMEI